MAHYSKARAQSTSQVQVRQRYARGNRAEAAIVEIAMSVAAVEELLAASRLSTTGAQQSTRTSGAVVVRNTPQGCPALIPPQHSAPSDAAGGGAVR
ncbi:MAG: hypothetical protein D6747_07190 [Chlorobiota bacterium]|nr:MAG: hypothetical protein D6747_07190 [Chlorobiota bacterium]